MAQFVKMQVAALIIEWLMQCQILGNVFKKRVIGRWAEEVLGQLGCFEWRLDHDCLNNMEN